MGTNLGGTNSHQRKLERSKAIVVVWKSVTLSLSQRVSRAISYTNYSKFGNRLPTVPLPERCELVRPDEQVKLGLRIFGLQGLKRIKRKSRCRAF